MFDFPSYHSVRLSEIMWQHAFCSSSIIFITFLCITLAMIIMLFIQRNKKLSLPSALSKLLVASVLIIFTVIFGALFYSTDDNDINASHTTASSIYYTQHYSPNENFHNKYSYYTMAHTYFIIHRNHYLIPKEIHQYDTTEHKKATHQYSHLQLKYESINDKLHIDRSRLKKQHHFDKLNEPYMQKKYFTKPNWYNYL